MKSFIEQTEARSRSFRISHSQRYTHSRNSEEFASIHEDILFGTTYVVMSET